MLHQSSVTTNHTHQTELLKLLKKSRSETHHLGDDDSATFFFADKENTMIKLLRMPPSLGQPYNDRT